MKVSTKTYDRVIKVLQIAKYHTSRDADIKHDACIDVAIDHMKMQRDILISKQQAKKLLKK